MYVREEEREREREREDLFFSGKTNVKEKVRISIVLDFSSQT